MIKVGDTFKAGDEVWEVIECPFDNWVYLTNHKHFTIEVIWHNEYMARKTSYGKGQYYLELLEMCMCIEIIDKLKGEAHDTK